MQNYFECVSINAAEAGTEVIVENETKLAYR